MKLHITKYYTLLSLALITLVFSCKNGNESQKTDSKDAVNSTNSTKQKSNKDYYHSMKAGVMAENDSNFIDSFNFFDNPNYVPSTTLSDKQLIDMGNIFRLDSTMMVKFDIRTPEELHGKKPEDTLVVGTEYFTKDLHDITESELSNLRHNLDMINNYKQNPATDGKCSGKDCPVYVHVDKTAQRLYLFIDGQPIDTFKTSSARKGYTTPNFDKKPDGRMFKKYTSHKYPQGDWNGLGNMPYAVFIEGGYAIHGATTGEIAQLGHPASHGCIRINPRNAKIFYNLVKYAGAENTWVHVTD